MNDATKEVKSGATSTMAGTAPEREEMTLVQELLESRRAALNLMEDAVEAREQAECAVALLRESETRHAFLLMLNDAIRPIADPAEIRNVASALLGQYIGASRVSYAEIAGDFALVRGEYVDGISKSPERFPVSVFGSGVLERCRQGEVVAVSDVANDTQFPEMNRRALLSVDIASFAGVMLVKGANDIAAFGAHHSTPRVWTTLDLELIRETAERTWAAVERARAEEALRASEERLQVAQEAANIGVWEWNVKTGQTYWSRTMWRIYGYDTELESADKLWEEHLHPDDAESSREEMRRIIQSGENRYNQEFRILRKDGSTRCIEAVARIERDANGKALRMLGVNVDVTDRRRGEEALKWSEERLRLLTESFEDFAIFTTDVDGSVVTWNPGAEKIFGYGEDEILNQNARILFVPEDQVKGEAEREMETARTTGRAADERWHLRKDGTRFYASGIMAPLYDGDTLIGYAKIARDLTKQKKAEEELRRQHEELETIIAGRTAELAEANQALRKQMNERRLIEEERFALLQKIVTTQEDERRRIARDMHDSLGQQLTALRLKLASMKTDLFQDGRLGANLEQLQELGKRIDSEVNFLVWQLRPTILDDLGLVAAIENYAREWSRHFGIPAEVHTGRFMKERLDTDTETNLYRILQEALNNAYKHGSPTNVNIVLESRRDQLVLVVEDDGTGFDPEQPKVAPDTGGGLGLIGIRERAAIIGGLVEIESAPGMGTTVFVRVPMRRGD